MKKYSLEICVDSVESAIEAKNGGAERLELCGNLMIGGTTPEYELFEQVKKETNLDLRVLIRPRFGDFLYTEKELERMEEQIIRFKEKGASGIVTGVLTKEGNLDLAAMKRLISAAGNRKVTLHRAFDVCKDPERTLKEAKELGVSTILTSGQERNAWEGRQLISCLLEEAGDSIEILIGGGVDPEVIERFLKETSGYAFHMSGKKKRNSSMEFKNDKVNMGIPGMDEYELWRTSREEVRKAVRLLKNR